MTAMLKGIDVHRNVQVTSALEPAADGVDVVTTSGAERFDAAVLGWDRGCASCCRRCPSKVERRLMVWWPCIRDELVRKSSGLAARGHAIRDIYGFRASMGSR